MNKRGVRIMKVWKRLLGGLLAGSLALSLAACGQAGGSSASAGDQSREEVPVSQETSGSGGSAAPDASRTEGTQAAPEGGTLVVYFSATGNTQAVAGYIADALGADLFEITPAGPYTSEDLNWTDESSRVNAEHDDPALQTVELESTSVEDWDSYDTVFIGYPIWWGVAAWPVSTFAAANDFTGKTVIPFCTSSSSGLGESGELLAQAAGTGTWLEGQRFRGSASETDVVDWVNSLGLTGTEE